MSIFREPDLTAAREAVDRAGSSPSPRLIREIALVVALARAEGRREMLDRLRHKEDD